MGRKCPYTAAQAGSGHGRPRSEAVKAWPIAFVLVKSKPCPSGEQARAQPLRYGPSVAPRRKSLLAIRGVRNAPFFDPAASGPGTALLRAGPMAAGHLLQPAGAPRRRPADGDCLGRWAAKAELGGTLELGRWCRRRLSRARSQGW